MVRPVPLLAVGLAASLVSTQAAPAQPTLRFPFDADFSGVSGVITFKWDSPKYSGAKVSADLKFDKMDFKALQQFDGNCTGPVTEYTWHIHTQWNMPPGRLSTSAALLGCTKAITGNHYDPYKVCGPASEYVDMPTCAAKVKEYACSPDAYKKNFAACEAGDLSGKFGKFKPDSKGVVKAEWYDQRFPFFSESTNKWNIVIHAVCGKATPRVSCGGVQGVLSSMRVVKKKAVEDEHDEPDEDDDDDDSTELLNDGKVRITIHKKNSDN